MASSVSPVKCCICLGQCNSAENDAHQENCKTKKKCYFCHKCNTHGANLCQICEITDQLSSICDIVDIEGEFKNSKEDFTNKAKRALQLLCSRKKTLQKMKIEKSEDKAKKETQLQKIIKEIEQDSITVEQIQKDIGEYDTSIDKTQEVIVFFQNARSIEEISKDFSQLQDKSGKLNQLLQEIDKKYCIRQVSEAQLKKCVKCGSSNTRKRRGTSYECNDCDSAICGKCGSRDVDTMGDKGYCCYDKDCRARGCGNTDRNFEGYQCNDCDEWTCIWCGSINVSWKPGGWWQCHGCGIGCFA